METNNKTNNQLIHYFFEAGIIAKGINSFFEILSGSLLLFVSKDSLVRLAALLTYEELSEDPRDVVANFLLNGANNLSFGAKEFGAIYLLTHGLIKAFLIIALLQKKAWAYPAAISVFGLFVAYQLYKFSYNHSPTMAILSVFDILVMIATWFEYQRVKKTSG